MTTATLRGTARPGLAGGTDAPAAAVIPRLTEGVELLGEYQGSGYTQPPSLIRRPDGQVIQMSRLLYLTAAAIDGTRDPAAIAELVSDDLSRELSADQARYLIDARLTPLGIIAGPAAPAAPPQASPLLALRARATLLPERAANAAGLLLRPLFRWPVIAAVAACVAGTDYWLFFVHGLGGGVHQVLANPASLLIILALSLLSAAFHECGHAAACRYGGARPGRIGVGLYLVWPSFFTNVTDSYRLSRAGRLRTDLGGLYFNLIFMLALAGLYTATRAQILLLVIALTHLEMLEQLLPFVRFDGYFILSDLTGVPDLFARVRPILASVLPRHRHDPRVTGLRRHARIAVTSWVLCVIPLLAATLGYMLAHLPSISRDLWQAASLQGHDAAAAAGAQHYATAALDVVAAALAALTLAGSLYVMTSLARHAAITGLRWSAGRPRRRILAGAAALGALAALAVLWEAGSQFRGW